MNESWFLHGSEDRDGSYYVGYSVCGCPGFRLIQVPAGALLVHCCVDVVETIVDARVWE